MEVLHDLVEKKVLGISLDSKVKLRYVTGEDVQHYNDDYQEGCFQNSGLIEIMKDLIKSGVDAKVLNSKFATLIHNAGDDLKRVGMYYDSNGKKYSLEEALVLLELSADSDPNDEETWCALTETLNFVPDDMNSYVTWNAYEFGIDTTLDQWDYKWGHYSMELELEVTVEAITSTNYNFNQFDITVETDVAFLRLK